MIDELTPEECAAIHASASVEPNPPARSFLREQLSDAWRECESLQQQLDVTERIALGLVNHIEAIGGDGQGALDAVKAKLTAEMTADAAPVQQIPAGIGKYEPTPHDQAMAEILGEKP